MGLEIDPKDPRVGELTAGIKTLEAEKGLTFDGADASFELYTRQQFGQRTSFFSLDRFRVIDERRHNAKGDEVTESMAMVQLEVADQAYIEAAPGNGPVDAINAALRKALLLYHPDKNRADNHGREWASTAEAVTRMATALLDYYRRRIVVGERVALHLTAGACEKCRAREALPPPRTSL